MGGKAVITGMFVAVGTSAVAVGGMYVPVGVGISSVAVAVTVAVVVAVAVAVAVAVDVGVDVGSCTQMGPSMVLESNVTAPVCARARPFRVAPVCRAMLVRARTSPIKLLFTPRVADEPTLHHILHGSPPITDAP